jgi:hypothetical protein
LLLWHPLEGHAILHIHFLQYASFQRRCIESAGELPSTQQTEREPPSYH